MANVINATSTGNGGLVSTGDDSGILNIQTNETTAISISAAQVVNFANAPTVANAAIVSAATPTVLGTVYGSTSTSSYTSYGYQAQNTAPTTANCVAIGFQAAYYQTGINNTAVGYKALYGTSGSSGTENAAVGRESLGKLTTGYYNNCLGYNSGNNITTGYQNTCIGVGAGTLLTTGRDNICIGRSAGENGGPVDGTSNTLIGWDARASASNGDTQLVLAARQSAIAKGNNTGFIDGGTGGIYQGNNSSSWSTTSDRRLKKNIVDNTDGLDKIAQIRVRNFEYRTQEEVTEIEQHCAVRVEGVQLGVIAQELQEICPDCVKTETTGVISVDSDNIFWHMVNAIKDLKALNDTLTARIVALETV